jgi:hypothetical protein
MSAPHQLVSRAVAPVALAIAMAVAGCSPAPAPPPRFPHKTHIDTNSVTCRSCHAPILERTQTGEPNSPDYAICRRCHQTNVGPGAKYAYDIRSTRSASPQVEHVIFSHKAHLERSRGQCVRCHRVGAESDARPAMLLPAMADCLTGCHQNDYDRLSCTRCHTSGQLARLRPVTDVPHGDSYVRRHGADAARASRLCQTCHAESFCADCHDTATGVKVELRRLDDIRREYGHRADFVTRHAIEARSSPSSCMRCHQPSSCDSCHVRNRVSGNARDAVSHHPAGWVGNDTHNPSFHGRAARRQILECAACHDQGPATNCIRCHRVGAYGGNPHPPGWRSTQRPEQGEMCQFCHAR